MTLPEFLHWVMRYDWLTVMNFADNELRAYIVAEDPKIVQDTFRTMFAGRITDDFTKSNGRYYFTISF